MEELFANEEMEKKGLADRLFMKSVNSWDVFPEFEREAVFELSERYKNFLDSGKTERECVSEAVRLLEDKGFVSVDQVSVLGKGDKVYKTVKGKGLVAAVIGEESMEKGLNILGAHVDSPRIDLKPAPVYEEAEMVFFKTHYYGGIKKYQWATIPLALHGIIYNEAGKKMELTIGEGENDPVFTINELLVHLSQEQMNRKASEAVRGEELNVLAGSIPYGGEDEKKRFKLGLLNLLYDTYGITERSFVTAEIELVPAFKAKDVGFDRGMVGAYGQDDRVCAFSALTALMEVEMGRKTAVCLFTDKEEVGSNGNTGALSRLYENVLMEMMSKTEGGFNELGFRKCLENSSMLSSDVTSCFDPTYSSAYDKFNTAYAGKGVCLLKYSGARGKSGANDANSEFFQKVATVFQEAGVVWQCGELGRVDLGGGGTIAGDMANLGINVIDCGVPVLSMHSPFEVTSKGDIYSTYKGFKEFLLNM